MKTFKLSISTPIGKNFESENVKQINANILEGRIGVMANHSPLVSSLKISDFSIILENGEELIGVVDGGIFNVTANEVTILTTRFDFDNEIDESEVNNEIKEIEYQLQADVKEAEQKSLGDRLQYANLKLEIAK